jgi:N-acetylmuramidase/Putative peptidoglycan binding domain
MPIHFQFFSEDRSMQIPNTMTREDRRSLQMALNEKTCSRLLIDGDFGRKSFDVLEKYQSLVKLPVTGNYDQPTFALLDPFIKQKYLVPGDYVTAAKDLGCELSAIKAVTEVEAAGDGFLPDGRCDILFERHKFYKYAGQVLVPADLAKAAADHSNVCNPKPGGYKGGEGEYSRLELANTINPWAALMSVSWGMFQIMGFNWKAMGYASVEEFVNASSKSEHEQLYAFVRFVKADARLLRAIRAKDWVAFAAAYNGANYAINKYDIKLQAADYSHMKDSTR